ncbi:MAG TPA: MBL fold metallo-hydrolase [Candidatus Polarisedimenticolaceae bacterium]|nr:MBL fold metallo-hydrolase [Candidatus Polarisedimenticolaceae bacterium]
MRIERIVLLGTAALAASSGCLAQEFPQLRRIAADVYAAIQPATQRFDDCNATIVLLDDGVLVVDTHNAPSTARAVIAEIKKLTPKPVRWVVDTHWHGDHTQGNRAYREAFPGVQILAHRNTREDIEKRGIPDLAEQLAELPRQIAEAEQRLTTLSGEERDQLGGRIERRKRQLEQLREVGTIALPDATFDGALTLHGSAGEVRLLHFPGHTNGDLVVHLPRQRVLVTGDLLDDLPYTGHGSPAGLVQTLGQLAALDWETMIPGHGSVRTGREHLARVRALFASIVEQTAAAVRAGKSKEDTVQQVDLARFESAFVTDDVSRRYWGFFMGEAVRRAYDEAKP